MWLSTRLVRRPGRITPLIVKAIQDIANTASTFQQNLIAWLGSASNGITDLYASIVHAHQVIADEVCANKSDGTPVCLTGDQFAALLSAVGASQPPESVTSSASNTSAPSLQNPSPPFPISVSSTTSTSTPPDASPTATSTVPDNPSDATSSTSDNSSEEGNISDSSTSSIDTTASITATTTALGN